MFFSVRSSLILSIQIFLYLPLLLFPSTCPCKAAIGNFSPSIRSTCPNHRTKEVENMAGDRTKTTNLRAAFFVEVDVAVEDFNKELNLNGLVHALVGNAHCFLQTLDHALSIAHLEKSTETVTFMLENVLHYFYLKSTFQERSSILPLLYFQTCALWS